jgi:hypothetical protein
VLKFQETEIEKGSHHHFISSKTADQGKQMKTKEYSLVYTAWGTELHQHNNNFFSSPHRNLFTFLSSYPGESLTSTSHPAPFCA